MQLADRSDMIAKEILIARTNNYVFLTPSHLLTWGFSFHAEKSKIRGLLLLSASFLAKINKTKNSYMFKREGKRICVVRQIHRMRFSAFVKH